MKLVAQFNLSQPRLFLYLGVPMASAVCLFLLHLIFGSTPASSLLTTLPHNGLSELAELFLAGLLTSVVFITSLIISIIASAKSTTLKQYIALVVPTLLVGLLLDFVLKILRPDLFIFAQLELIYFPLFMIPGLLVGLTLRFTKALRQLKISKKLLLLSFSLAIFGLFATGSIFNTVIKEQFNKTYHYYLHRGLPIPFSGVSERSKPVPSNYIKLPFFSEKLQDDSEYVKIVNLPMLALSLIIYWILALIPAAAALTLKINKKTAIVAYLIWLLLVGYTIFMWGQIIL